MDRRLDISAQGRPNTRADTTVAECAGQILDDLLPGARVALGKDFPERGQHVVAVNLIDGCPVCWLDFFIGVLRAGGPILSLWPRRRLPTKPLEKNGLFVGRFICWLVKLNRFRDKGIGPASVLFDDLVDLGHDTDGLADGDDDLLVVVDVLVG